MVPENDTPDTTADGQQPTDAPPKTQTLDELLADLDEDRRKVILEQVNKPRNEAKNLRERLKAAEPRLAEYDRLVAASKTEQERAQEALAAAEDRASRASSRIARAEVKAALAGIVDDPDLIVDDLDLRKFIDEDGDVDQDAIAAIRQKYTALGGRRAPRPDPSQASGANGRSTPDPKAAFASILNGLNGRT